MISLYNTEHFSNHRALRIGEIKKQAVHKSTKRELNEYNKAQICLNCTRDNCKKGYCDLMKDMGSQSKYKKVRGEKL